ncbi:hypothetical protein, partial [Stenotrophomonas maltophilia]
MLQANPQLSIQALAKATDLDLDLVRDLVHLAGSQLSIDATFSDIGSSDSDNQHGLYDLLPDPNNDFMSEIEEAST